MRLLSISIDQDSVPPAPPETAQELQVAIADLLAVGEAQAPGAPGPYHLHLACPGPRLAFDLRDEAGETASTGVVTLARLRRPLADYAAICRSYAEAAAGHRERLEAVDMARRALHNDGATLLQDQLADAFAIDHETARRLWTLVCTLPLKG